MYCFAHTLQLAVNSGLDSNQISRLTAVARKLVGHFKHSAVSMTALKEKQQQMNIPQHHLIQDVATRWNSTYFMMDSIIHDALTEKAEMMLSPDETEDIEPASKKKKPETALSFLLGEDEDTSGKEEEIERFLREPTLSSEDSSLEWWRKNAERFTTLACMARTLLCIPATSVGAERVFSTAGLVINQQRCSLLPENVDMLVFLRTYHL